MNMPATETPTDDILNAHLERDLPVLLNDTEQLDRFKVAAAKRKELAKLAAQAVRSREEWKDKLNEVETEIVTLETAASTGKETRPVDCFERFKGGSVETVRYDTGEVVFVRTATPSDRQLRVGVVFDAPVDGDLLGAAAHSLDDDDDDDDDEPDPDDDATPEPVTKLKKAKR